MCVGEEGIRGEEVGEAVEVVLVMVVGKWWSGGDGGSGENA